MKKDTKTILISVAVIILILPLIPIGGRTYNVEIVARGYAAALPLSTDRPGYGGISAVTFSDVQVGNLGNLVYYSLFPFAPGWTNKTSWVPPQTFPSHKANFVVLVTFKSSNFVKSFDSPTLSLDNSDEYNANATIVAGSIPAGSYSVVVALLINGVTNPPLANNYTLTLP